MSLLNSSLRHIRDSNKRLDKVTNLSYIYIGGIMDSRLKEKIQILYKKGLSFRQIGERLHISHETVRQVIPQKARRRQRMDQKMIDRIVEVFKKTGSYTTTAEELGLPNRQTVYRVAVREGLV